MNDVSVRASGLTVAYGNMKVLDNLSISVAKGEFLVLLGSSGCGKSTLLNAIAGLQDITDGIISISGKDVTHSDPKDRGIGMVFQSYALYPRMTVEQNMSFGLKIRGIEPQIIRERVKRTAEILHIQHLLGRRPADLSGGQRQRVAIGRALVRDVDVFLFDEPLSNLDAQLRTELRVELKKLHKRLGNTMIYVTHDQVEAMTLADRIAVMQDGLIQQLGSPAEIYDRPANLFVAGFLGSPKMNFVSGSIVSEAGGAVYWAPGIHVPLTAPAEARSEVVLGVRPEHLTIVEEASSAAIRSAVVTVIEQLGPEAIVWAEVEGNQVAIRCAPEVCPALDQKISIALDAAKISLFDHHTGLRLSGS